MSMKKLWELIVVCSKVAALGLMCLCVVAFVGFVFALGFFALILIIR